MRTQLCQIISLLVCMSIFYDILIASATNSSLPVITLSLLIRNKAYALRHTLAYVEILDYPKTLINLYIRTDNNEDESEVLIRQWTHFWKDKFRDINAGYNEDCNLIQESPLTTSANWTINRQRRVTNHLNNALQYSMEQNSKYWVNMDADVILMNNQTVKQLLNDFKIKDDAVLIAPLLDCPSRKDFSNFWLHMGHNMTFDANSEKNGIFIRNHTKVGIHQVSLVHTLYILKLVNINWSIKQLNTSMMQPEDGRYYPIFSLHQMLYTHGFKNNIYVDNQHFFGYFPSPISHEFGLPFEEDVFVHLKLQVVTKKLASSLKQSEDELKKIKFESPFISTRVLHAPVRIESHRYGLAEAYVLNLKRRQERRNYMKYAFEELGIDGRLISAVDGKSLNYELLQLMNITQLKHYLDPSFHRPMTFGEVACFLSHYYVWKDVVNNQYERVMVLEDDVRFSPIFNQGVWAAIDDADYLVPDWDMIYLGRKLLRKNELKVPHSAILKYPKYSYWTIGYILTYSGAKKLLNQDPLKHMLPVDEYLPLMFDQHPNPNWSDQYKHRDLIALATDPSLIEPLFFKGEETYTSDTESSELAF